MSKRASLDTVTEADVNSTISKLKQFQSKAERYVADYEARVRRQEQTAEMWMEYLETAVRNLRQIAALRREPLIARYDRLRSAFSTVGRSLVALREWCRSASLLKEELDEAISRLNRRREEARAVAYEMQEWAEQAQQKAREWPCFERQASEIKAIATDVARRMEGIAGLDSIEDFEGWVHAIWERRREAESEHNQIMENYEELERLKNQIVKIKAAWEERWIGRKDVEIALASLEEDILSAQRAKDPGKALDTLRMCKERIDRYVSATLLLHPPTIEQVGNRYYIIIGQIRIDFLMLADQLSMLLPELKRRAQRPEHQESIREVGEAVRSAMRGDGQGVLSHLKKAGKWALKIAEEVGVELAVLAIKAAIGL